MGAVILLQFFLLLLFVLAPRWRSRERPPLVPRILSSAGSSHVKRKTRRVQGLQDELNKKTKRSAAVVLCARRSQVRTFPQALAERTVLLACRRPGKCKFSDLEM